MSATKYDNLSASLAKSKAGSDLPCLPYIYYGQNISDVDSITWEGGELFYHTTYNRLYIQTSTSGTTPVWKRLSDQFATTTSTSTSTSSSTSTSTSTSSTTTMA